MELIIAANWKMHKTAAEAAVFCHLLRQNEEFYKGVEVVVCPPFTALSSASAALEGSSIKLGAQNMHFEQSGAYTGEIAAPMLLEYGVEYVIIGHSERRQLFAEDNDQVRRKVQTAIENGLKPILCIGETEEERERGLTEKVIEAQLAGVLKGRYMDKVVELVVAYEPVWAIGSGKAASAEDAENAGAFISRYFRNNFGEKLSTGLRIQYGGSVKAENIGSFVSSPSIHGALVGGASLEADSFIPLIQAARKAV